jgi:hypothetical protein
MAIPILSRFLACGLLAFAGMAAAQPVSVLDTERGVQTACGSDRTANLARPWVTASWAVSKGYDIRLPMDSLIAEVDASGRFTICLDALASALIQAEARGLPVSLTLFSGLPPTVVAYGEAQGEPTWIYTDPNPRHPGYGIPVKRLVPWAPTALRAQREIYAAIRNLVQYEKPGAPGGCFSYAGKRVCRPAQGPMIASRLTYFVHSPLPGMRYLRTIAGENDPTVVQGYSRAVLEATVAAGYANARGIAPLQVHEFYEVRDGEGSLVSASLEWARAAGDVGIFVENLQPGYPTCLQGHGRILCEAGLPVVFEMVGPLGATDVVAAIDWARTLSPAIRDVRIYVDDADLFAGGAAKRTPPPLRSPISGGRRAMREDDSGARARR